MQQESLDKALDAVLVGLDKAEIDSVDKVELLINLKLLLENVDRYTQSMRVLQREIPSKREVYKSEPIRRY